MNTKRTVLVLALAIGLAPVIVGAQSSIVSQIAGDKAATEKLYFSLKFGLNATTLKGMDAEKLGGFNVGIAATIRLSDRLSLVPEFAPVSRRGVTAIPFITTGDSALDPYFADPKRSALVLDYTDVPIVVQYRLGRFHLGAGAFASFLVSASERFRAELETGEELLHTRDVTAEFRNLDYGLVFEGSWTITKPRRGTGLVFHVRVQKGLADVLVDPAASGAVRSSILQIFLSFPFIR
jgi:hypothetical protein